MSAIDVDSQMLGGVEFPVAPKKLRQLSARYKTRHGRHVRQLFPMLCAFVWVLFLAGCGSGASAPIPDKPVRVEQRGDSITHQAGQMLADYLPVGSTVINLGVDGAMARDITVPAFQSGTVYTFSYGTNECLGGVSPDDYRATLNHILNAGRGYSVVLEAPWRVVDPRCNPTIEQYRQVVVDLGKQYSVPVVIEDDQTFNAIDGIHIPESHMRSRAQLLAEAIKAL